MPTPIEKQKPPAESQQTAISLLKKDRKNRVLNNSVKTIRTVFKS